MFDNEPPGPRDKSDNDIADLNTNEFAEMVGVKPATVLRGYCVNGHYMGLRPKTLPNGRHRWSGKKASALLEL